VQVRGKTVYLQYSTRQEIVNATSSAEEPSNVLLATLENLQPDTIITIEQLWAVFAAFGNVQKIATFEKSAGFQALVQYESAPVAKAAKDQLDGRTIPRSILQSRTPCQLRIAFSGHRDLNVKFQSHRGRDFTNPDLPWADVDPEVAAKGIQGALSHTPDDGNVLLVQVRATLPVSSHGHALLQPGCITASAAYKNCDPPSSLFMSQGSMHAHMIHGICGPHEEPLPHRGTV
jgi:polypyrimidine tract-binding protein 2